MDVNVIEVKYYYCYYYYYLGNEKMEKKCKNKQFYFGFCAEENFHIGGLRNR